MNLDPLLNIYFPKHCFYWFLSFSWTFHPSLALSIHLREGLAARSEGGGCAVWCVSDDAYSVESQPVPSCPLATMVWQYVCFDACSGWDCQKCHCSQLSLHLVIFSKYVKKDLLWTKTLSLEPIVNVNGVNVTDVDCIILSTYTSFFVLVKKLYKIKFL